MIVPVFSVYGQHYQHATPFLTGLAIGMYGLGQAIFQIPMSIWADKFPRKPIIIAGLALFALGGAICALATDIHVVILGRLIAGSGAVSAVAMALLADVTREQKPHQSYGDDGANHCDVYYGGVWARTDFDQVFGHFRLVLADRYFGRVGDVFVADCANARTQTQTQCQRKIHWQTIA